ncbi:MAG TPA: tetratricopeptide repeat protein [Streptosporangiaceae bacterium]|nr:tetratricopeptide repeat protein [Streptosporangiaceae bacterium]
MNEVGTGEDRPATEEGAGPARGNELGGTVHGSAVQAGSIHGDVHFHDRGPSPMPVPSQLPPIPPNFTNRSAELATLTRLLDDTEPKRPARLAVIMGAAGIGKTSLALRWLHEVRNRFPAGQLYADLGGHLPSSATRPADILGRFLRSAGLPPDRVPLSAEEAAALWRSVTTGRPLIVLLDNAASAAQVRAVLPGDGPSLVVVTTRWRLGGLAIDGAHFTELSTLDETGALELLDRIVGAGRVSAEPEASRAVAQMCGYLPLAICVSAARLAPNPRWRVQRIADELASERHRLAALSLTEDLSVRAAFDISYRALPPGTACAYRLLSLLPGPDFTADLAAAAAATDPPEMTRLLDMLTDASLLVETATGRFRFHDLVRLHAREQADADSATERGAVTRRAIEWYLTSAVAADLVVIPGRWQLSGRYEQARQSPDAFASPAEALTWLETELPGLLASVHAAPDAGLHEQAWQLCEALWGLFLYRRHFPEWIASHQTGLASAQACGDPRAQARMRDQLGFAFLCLRRYDEAQQQFTEAITLARQAGHRLGEAAPLEHLGITLLGLGRPGDALPCFTSARATHQDLGRPRGIALMTRHIGEAHTDAGRYGEAVEALQEARRLFAALPDPYNEARTKTNLAEAYLRAQRPAEAAPLLNEALTAMTRLGARDKQAGIHVLLADAAEQQGDPARAGEHLAEAITLYEDLGAPEGSQIRLRHAAHRSDAGPPASHNEQDRTPP